MTKKVKNPTYKKLGYSGMDTVKIVNNLNTLLANYQIHYQKLRNFHWNVKGGDFFDMHEKFEELYTSAMENIDEIAERIKVYGETPLSTLKEYLDTSEIQEVGTDLSSDKMVAEVLKDMETLDSFMIDAVEAASEIGDVASVDLLNSMIKTIEKEHWMLTSFLSD